MSHSSSTAHLETFRAEVRVFLQREIPADIAASVRANCLVTREQARRWQRILHERGWAAPGWPTEYGGPGWSLVEQAVFREELAASDAPRFENLGVDTIGPTLIRHGTPEQCARFLPNILSFDDYWAQAYSEPDAGSDLVALRTTARRDGSDWIVSGTKIWQSYGHWANWALVLVRTDPGAGRKQDGISVLLMDLTAPGVTVRPIRFMNGAQFHVQLFFDDVRVPAENLLGTEGTGWAVAKGLLVIERLFLARVAECKAELGHIAALAQGRGANGTSLLDDEIIANQHAELDIRVRALDAVWWPAVRAAQAGAEPALEASLLKLQGSELLQDLQQMQMQVLGLDTLPFDPEGIEGKPSEVPFLAGHPENLPLHMWRYRGITLGGGTSEVQRQIIAKNIFSGETELDRTQDAGMSEQQTMLDDALRRLLADRYDFDLRREIIQRQGSFDGGLWQALAELGLTGLLAPERDGGFGGTLADLLPAMETLGESLVVEPVLWSAGLATQLLIDASEYTKRSERLEALVSGSARAVLAHLEHSTQSDAMPLGTTARQEAGGWRINGRKRFVMGGDQAQYLIVSARLEGGGTALFDIAADSPGLALRRYRLHDGRGAADLEFHDLALPAAALLAGPERATAMLDEAQSLATVALCAESIGTMRRALALTVDYLRTRKQFGRSLADYQALQHRMVEHYRAWTSARMLVREAADGWASVSTTQRQLRVSAAKWMCGKAGQSIALDVLQMHGAVGLQDETAISHYAKRLMSNELLLGTTSQHLGRFVNAARQHRNDEGVGT